MPCFRPPEHHFRLKGQSLSYKSNGILKSANLEGATIFETQRRTFVLDGPHMSGAWNLKAKTLAEKKAWVQAMGAAGVRCAKM